MMPRECWPATPLILIRVRSVDTETCRLLQFWGVGEEEDRRRRGRGNEERKKEHLPQDDGRNKVNKLTPRACSPSINNGVRAARPL